MANSVDPDQTALSDQGLHCSDLSVLVHGVLAVNTADISITNARSRVRNSWSLSYSIEMYQQRITCRTTNPGITRSIPRFYSLSD